MNVRKGRAITTLKALYVGASMPPPQGRFVRTATLFVTGMVSPWIAADDGMARRSSRPGSLNQNPAFTPACREAPKAVTLEPSESAFFYMCTERD